MKTNATLTSIKQNDSLDRAGSYTSQQQIVLGIMQAQPSKAWLIPEMCAALVALGHVWGSQKSTVSRVFFQLTNIGEIERSDFDCIKSEITGVKGMARRLTAKHRQVELC
jgi:hypothetical protein